jgi:hypothetical protein
MIDLSRFTLFKPVKLTKEERKQILQEIKELNERNKSKPGSSPGIILKNPLSG